MTGPATTTAQSPAPRRPGRRRWSLPQDFDSRWGLLWLGLFAVTLAVPTVMAVVDATSAGTAVRAVGLTVAVGGWTAFFLARERTWGGRWPMFVWLAGVCVLVPLALEEHGAYVMLMYGVYPLLFALLGRWAVPGVVLFTVAAWLVLGERTGQSGLGNVVALGGSVLLAVTVGVFISAIERESAKRREALEALDATRADLAATARRTGMLEERERLAREIHDTVAQGFTGIVMQLEAAEQAFDRDPSAARAHLDRARTSARESLAEIRRSVHALRPELLDAEGLQDALRRIADRWAADTGILATVRVSGEPQPLTPDRELALLRAAQEALANVARHSEARRVTVALAHAPDEVRVVVTDDGRGFDPATAAGGMGLRGLQDRLADVGGHGRIESAPGEGTRVVLEVPVP